MLPRLLPLLVVLSASLAAPRPAAAAAAARTEIIEEIVVTARRHAEPLREVPVTVAALTEADLDRYHITDMVEASKLIPNLIIAPADSGNGANLFLRGVGSSSISAAFDQSVAINIDGVVVNIGRFIHNAYLDMGQLEVLKGPQSLYFGKSATAGVLSVTTNDPGDVFEMSALGGYEAQFDRHYGEFIVSAPLSGSLGARLAAGYSERNHMYENLSPFAQHRWRGEDALNARLTLLWQPAQRFRARLKYAYSAFHNDGPTGAAEELCPEGRLQPTAIPSAEAPFRTFVGVDDCLLNGNTSTADLLPELSPGLPQGAADGVPFLKQHTHFLALQADWEPNDRLALTSVTGYVDLVHWDLDVYDYNAGVFGGLHNNVYRSFSEEIRLTTRFDGPLNVQAGLYYQDVTQRLRAYQHAFNLAVTPNFLGADAEGFGFDPNAAFFGLDPVTGNGYDYNKNHFLDTQVWSGFVAAYWDLTANLELTAGLRYTDERKNGYITFPYFHAAAAIFGFGAPAGGRLDGLRFDDDNLSPEIAASYHLTPNLSLFASYKRGFKSGGIDNSALPTASLNQPAAVLRDALSYQSEKAEGFEAGMKGRFAEGRVRVNASTFFYTYSDLQVQSFNGATIQFETGNASELEATGAEIDLLWLTDLPGVTVRAALAYTDTAYSKAFCADDCDDETFRETGIGDLNGSQRPQNARWAGFVGAELDFWISSGWRVNIAADARYSDGYALSNIPDPYRQRSYWLLDTAVRLISADERYELAVIGRNLTDEIVAYTTGGRPGACANFNPAGAPVCASVSENDQDQIVRTGLGSEYALQLSVRF